MPTSSPPDSPLGLFEPWPNATAIARTLEAHVFLEVYVLDADSRRFLHMNEFALANLGCRAATATQLDADDVFLDMSEHDWDTLTREAIMRGGYEFACSRLHRDGSAHTIQAKAVAATFASGDINALVIMALDVSPQLEIAKALDVRIKSQQVLNRLLKLSLDVDFLDEALERALEIILDAPWMSALRKGAIFLAEPDSGRMRMVCHRGMDGLAVHELGDFVVPLVIDGKAAGALNLHVPRGHQQSPQQRELLDAIAGVLACVIERKRVDEEMIKAREQALHDARCKSRFLARMSHEIRTPMNGVLGVVQLLKHTPLTVEQRELLSTLEASGQTLMQVIDDILDLSKIEAGKMALEAVPFDVQRLVSDVTIPLRDRADSKCVIVTWSVADDVPDRLVGDPVRVRQILSNLLDNALKFTSAGVVGLAVTRVVVDDTPWLQFDVCDTGIGLTLNEQNRLFQPYAQADGSTARRFGGTGLGLPICRHLVNLMGGTITVTSAPGCGSTFSVVLPLGVADPPGDRPDPADDHAERATELRLLLAEDTPVNQKVLTRMLRSLGYSVDVVSNGREAVEAAKSRPYAAVLMDVVMPDIDGLTATRRLRADGYTRPIIALTASALPEDKQRCLDAGMTTYLRKPIKLDALRVALEALCDASVTTGE